MNAQQLAQRSTFGVWKRIVGMVATARAPLAVKAEPQAGWRAHDTTTHVRIEGLFVRALVEDSNLELDWLWLAKHVQREHERRYCWERVLYINPHNTIARTQLARLGPIPVHFRRQAGTL